MNIVDLWSNAGMVQHCHCFLHSSIFLLGSLTFDIKNTHTKIAWTGPFMEYHVQDAHYRHKAAGIEVM